MKFKQVLKETSCSTEKGPGVDHKSDLTGDYGEKVLPKKKVKNKKKDKKKK